jgi:outer membrane protein assembly factor BamB
MNTSELLFIGAKAHVAAINRRDGKLLWKTKLTGGLKISGSGFVTVLVEEGRVYAYTYGSLYCLDAANGQKLFDCEIAGLGRGIAMLATIGHSSPPVAAAGHELEAATDDGAVVAAAAAAAS